MTIKCRGLEGYDVSFLASTVTWAEAVPGSDPFVKVTMQWGAEVRVVPKWEYDERDVTALADALIDACRLARARRDRAEEGDDGEE